MRKLVLFFASLVLLAFTLLPRQAEAISCCSPGLAQQCAAHGGYCGLYCEDFGHCVCLCFPL
jgi:hypothetical protein